jgi:uncharacterized Zn-finger protein
MEISSILNIEDGHGTSSERDQYKLNDISSRLSSCSSPNSPSPNPNIQQNNVRSESSSVKSPATESISGTESISSNDDLSSLSSSSSSSTLSTFPIESASRSRRSSITCLPPLNAHFVDNFSSLRPENSCYNIKSIPNSTNLTATDICNPLNVASKNISYPIHEIPRYRYNPSYPTRISTIPVNMPTVSSTYGVPTANIEQIKQHCCSTCGKRFARKSDRVRHEYIHSGHRPNQCNICGKQFIQRSALTVHIRVHTGEKPHKCESCYKAFSDSSSLARHRRTHTGTRPFTCPFPGCNKDFTRKTTLTRHVSRHSSPLANTVTENPLVQMVSSLPPPRPLTGIAPPGPPLISHTSYGEPESTYYPPTGVTAYGTMMEFPSALTHNSMTGLMHNSAEGAFRSHKTLYPSSQTQLITVKPYGSVSFVS